MLYCDLEFLKILGFKDVFGSNEGNGFRQVMLEHEGQMDEIINKIIEFMKKHPLSVDMYAGKRIKATEPKKKALEFAKTAANKIGKKLGLTQGAGGKKENGDNNNKNIFDGKPNRWWSLPHYWEDNTWKPRTGHKSGGGIYNTLELWNLCIATINGINTNNSHITYFRSNLAFI